MCEFTSMLDLFPIGIWNIFISVIIDNYLTWTQTLDYGCHQVLRYSVMVG